MRNNIIILIDITEEAYNNMFLDFGMAYCKHYAGDDTLGYECLVSNQHFWQWWKNQYATVDKSFIKKYSNTAHSNEFLQDKYIRLHEPKYLNIYPSDYVISATFGGIVYGKKQKKEEVC
ncbi:MAG: hypothetical protein RJA25_2230 [Bacteroidota bacterium]|jgi:hypothetical protein